MEDYNDQLNCIYKSEYYSVRDNGAVFRHSRKNERIRKLDNQWTFGTPNKYGYLLIATEVVHRIVATAFHGEAPTAQHVVDHIDTNKHNNRPENLRWLTKLENILNNPITLKRIIKRCGSIEAFLENPSILKEFEDDDPNYTWMRAVTPEEAKISWERMSKWAKKEISNDESSNGQLGEWVFQSNENAFSKEEPTDINSETPNAMQRNWKTPCKFPLCPQMNDNMTISSYFSKLLAGDVFAQNKYNSTFIEDFAISNDGNIIWVLGINSEKGAIKPWSLAKITLENGFFVHESLGSFFGKDGAEKYFTLAQGLGWNGGDTLDDYT